MEIRHLRYFVTVADELHFTRAAARLQTAQPALSQHIRKLERELDTQLFVRTNRSVELTHTGRVLLEHARRVLDDADRAKRAVQQAEQGDLGHLTIGFRSHATAELLSDLLVTYRARHARVEIALRDLGNAAQIDALTNGTIDIGLMTRRVNKPQIRTLQLQRLRLVVAIPASHRLADRPSIRLRELANERWIHPMGHSSPFFSACAKAGFEPLITLQAAEHTARMTLVAAGLGIAVDLESAPHLLSPHIVYRPLTHPQAAVDLVAAWREDRASPLIDSFVDIARTRRRQAPPLPEQQHVKQ